MLDTLKIELHKNYKLSTADMSQVCDGGGWESYRRALEVKSTADEIANKLAYRPARRKSHSRSSGSRCHADVFEQKQEDAPTPSSFLPRASLTDDDSIGFLDLSEKTEASERSRVSSASNRSVERRESMPTSSSNHKRRSSRPRRSSDSDAPKNMVMRKLSKPRHRSMSNNSLSGIMRPSRYSSNNLGGMDTVGERGRISSCLNLNVLPENSCKLPRTLSATWIAPGVEFSKNMEVYVFER